MSQLITVDRATLEQLVAVADKFINKVETGQARSVETYNDLIAVRKSCSAALANAELVKDAERYRWLRDYLISPSTHFDDLIVSADKADTLDGVIDAARAKGAK